MPTQIRIQQQFREDRCLLVFKVCKSCDFMVLSLDLGVPASCFLACRATEAVGHSRVLNFPESFSASFVA